MEKKLFRSRKEKMIGGVAGGLAQYFETDAVLIRVLFVVGAFFHGLGLIAYLLFWIITPQEPFVIFSGNPGSAPGTDSGTDPLPEDAKNEPGKPFDEAYKQTVEKRKYKRNLTSGIILIIFGVFLLADNLIPSFDLGDIFPLLLIVVGISFLINATKTKVPL